MADELLRLFPLEVVLLPGTPMPLHIFEERYKELINDCRRNRTEFGIVQAGEGGVLNIGCTATVERVVTEYPDGRMDIVVVGRRRFELVMLDDTEACLRANVSFFDDDDVEASPVELRAMAIAGLNAVCDAQGKELPPMPQHDDPQLSFKIAWFVEDLSLRQTLLSLRSETERLRVLTSFLPEYVAKARRTAHIKRVAPRNGHGYAPTGTEDPSH